MGMVFSSKLSLLLVWFNLANFAFSGFVWLDGQTWWLMNSELPTSGLPTKQPILRWAILRFTALNGFTFLTHFSLMAQIAFSATASVSVFCYGFVWFGLVWICLHFSLLFVWFDLSLFALLCDSLSDGQNRPKSQSEFEPVCLAGKVWAAIQSSLLTHCREEVENANWRVSSNKGFGQEPVWS